MTREINISKFAPIAIPTLCRFEHLKRLLESLERCKHADKTAVYIAVDYPSKNEHFEGYYKIVEYLKNRSFNFGDLIVIYREVNYGFGPKGNSSCLINKISKLYDSYIFTEDDNEFAPSFLDYMNQCLERYKDDPEIFAVCGYMFKQQKINSKYTVFKNQLYCAWGTGFWVNKRRNFDKYCQKEKIREIVENPKVKKHFSKYAKLTYLTLLRISENGNILGDVVVSGYLIHKGMKCIFPAKSLVRNWGWDGSGTHGGVVEGYSTQEIDTSDKFHINEALNDVSDQICLQQYIHWQNEATLVRKCETMYSWIIANLTNSYHDLSWLKKIIKKFKG